jgi:hypothetical protein
LPLSAMAGCFTGGLLARKAGRPGVHAVVFQFCFPRRCALVVVTGLVAGMERLAFVGGGCASFAAFSVVIDHFMKFS